MRANFFRLLFIAIFLFAFQPYPASASDINTPHKKVLITGGAGFIGSNFLHYMFQKHPEYDFIVLDALTYAGSLERIPEYIQNSKRFEFIHGNIVDSSLINSIVKNCNYIVHFAAETHVTRSIAEDKVFFETDIIGTRELMRAVIQHKDVVERFIHISTSEVYGTAEYSPMDENHPLNPRSPYAAAKAGADRLVYSYYCTYDAPVSIIRPFNNYGFFQHQEKVIPRFITQAIQGEKLTIQGTGTQSRDWVYTLDLCDAIDKALHIPNFEMIKGEVINVGSGVDISIADVAKTVLDCLGHDFSQIKFVPDRPGQVARHIADITKAKKLLGWEPKVNFYDGMKETVAWYQANKEFWQKLEDQKEVTIKDLSSGKEELL